MKRVNFASTIASLALICVFILLASGRNCDECFSLPVMAFKVFICGLVIAIGGIYFTKEFLHNEKIIFEVESLPILETDEAVEGIPFAGEGVIEAEKLLESPYTKTPCVYFHAIKEKYVRKSRGGDWEVIENVALFVPFYVRDKRGRLRVDLTNLDDDFSSYEIPLHNYGVPNPKNSEVDCEAVLKHQPFPLEKKPQKKFFTFRSSMRVSEFVLKPGTKVFVYGMVSKKNGELVLHEAEGVPLIISRKNRDQYVQEFYRGENLTYLSHFLVSLGFTISLLAINYFLHLDWFLILSFVFLGNLIILGSVFFSIYNRIVTLRNRALNAKSNIEVELKRRADLIPNIVEIVKRYVHHEREVQNIIAQGRAEMIFSHELQKEENPIIPSLALVIERYPELKASENFQSLMKILVDTEERIAYSREFYNRTVRKYNTLIQQIPFSFVASILGFKEMEFLNILRGDHSSIS